MKWALCVRVEMEIEWLRKCWCCATSRQAAEDEIGWEDVHTCIYLTHRITRGEHFLELDLRVAAEDGVVATEIFQQQFTAGRSDWEQSGRESNWSRGDDVGHKYSNKSFLSQVVGRPWVNIITWTTGQEERQGSGQERIRQMG